MTPGTQVETSIGCGRGLVIGYTDGIMPVLWRCGQYSPKYCEVLYCRDCLKRLETSRVEQAGGQSDG